MGCGSSKSYLETEAENQAGNAFCDINELTRAYAKDQFVKTATWSQSRIPLSDLVFTPHWEQLSIKHDPPVYQDVPSDRDEQPVEDVPSDRDEQPVEDVPSDRDEQPVEDVPSDRDEQPVVLLNEEYQNILGTEVRKTFKGERNTTCLCEVELENGVIFHKGVDIALKTFGENPAGRKFPRAVTLGKHPGDLSIPLEETIPWTLETTVPIRPFTTVVARIHMEEEEHDLTFSMVTKVTVPQKGLRISVRDKEGNFITTLTGYPQRFLEGVGDKVQVYDNKVQFVSEGKAYFRFGTKTVEDSQETNDPNQQQRHQEYLRQQQQQHQQYLQQQQQHNHGIYPKLPGMDN